MLKRVFSIIFIAALLPHAVAQELSNTAKFEAAQILERLPPTYPRGNAKQQDEGWVDLIFTVGVDGTTHGIEMTGHSGVEGFVKPAIEAVSKYKYLPATLDGIPVESLQDIRILFIMSNNPKVAGKKFARYFERFRKAAIAENLSEAHTHLAELRKLKANNLYEGAYLNLAEYYYGQITKNGAGKQRRHLEAATRLDLRDKPYISNAAWVDAKRAEFGLLIESADYGLALKVYEDIPDKKRFAELRTELLPFVEQIRDIRTNDKSFATTISLGSEGFGGTTLLKRAFTVTELIGEIERFKLDCDSGFKGLQFVENAEYQLPASYGKCTLRVKGEPGSQFSLVQLPLPPK